MRQSWWPVLVVVLFGTADPNSAWGAGETSHAAAPAGKTEPSRHSGNSGAAHSPIEHVLDTAIWQANGYRIVSKYMILEAIAAVLVAAIYIPVARRSQNGAPPRGWLHNLFEVLLTFIREDVAKPALGEHEADRYLPFLWTMFLFILFCNLLGLIPFAGSPTADIWMTGGLAVCSFFAIHGSAVAKMGFLSYLKSLWPHLDIPIPIAGFFIKLMVCVIEIFGLLIKNSVLAVRLFANMLGGHSVLAMILLFIIMTAKEALGLWVTITIGSVLGIVALSLLELFIACLQAYIFVFLTALFIGMAIHPAH